MLVRQNDNFPVSSHILSVNLLLISKKHEIPINYYLKRERIVL